MIFHQNFLSKIQKSQLFYLKHSYKDSPHSVVLEYLKELLACQMSLLNNELRIEQLEFEEEIIGLTCLEYLSRLSMHLRTLFRRTNAPKLLVVFHKLETIRFMDSS